MVHSTGDEASAAKAGEASRAGATSKAESVVAISERVVMVVSPV
jgi:hypothetical protein